MSAPYYQDESVTLWHGDCIEVLRELPDASVHAVVTDPPYGLANTTPTQVADTVVRWVNGDRDYLPGGAGFMGKSWDAFVPPVAVWDECFRVLKPGGHVLAFAGSRTADLMGLSIRLAGFDLRDSISWLYGSGFPKSLDVSKAVDRFAHAAPLWDDIRQHIRQWRDRAGMTNPDLNAALGLATNGAGMARHWTSEVGGQHSIPSKDMWGRLKALLGWPDCDLDTAYDAVKDGADRPTTGVHRQGITRSTSGLTASGIGKDRRDIAATPDAARWQGWGTALKPAHEPIIVARKPLAGTVAANVLAHGTGGINVDGCRVAAGQDYADKCASVVGLSSGHGYSDLGGMPRVDSANPSGRWPANVLLDTSQAAALDEESGVSRDGVAVNRNRGDERPMTVAGTPSRVLHEDQGYGSSGGASRFFPTFHWQAKADTAQRPRAAGVSHPTVKPLDLMRWLVRLVTPPGGTVLEPFAGSGTTVEACLLEGFACIAIEREADYLPLIRERINRQTDPVAYHRDEAADDPEYDAGLFGLLDGDVA